MRVCGKVAAGIHKGIGAQVSFLCAILHYLTPNTLPARQTQPGQSAWGDLYTTYATFLVMCLINNQMVIISTAQLASIL